MAAGATMWSTCGRAGAVPPSAAITLTDPSLRAREKGTLAGQKRRSGVLQSGLQVLRGEGARGAPVGVPEW
eukprot:4670597-Pyramimonas_sp.AAC.1